MTAAAVVAAVRPAAAAGRPAGPGPQGLQDAFAPLAGAQVRLATGTITVPPNPVQPERHFLSTYFVATWSRELSTDPFFGPIFKGAAATVGCAVDCRGHSLAPATQRQAGGAFIIGCCLLYRRGRGKRTGCVCLTRGVESPLSCRSATIPRWAGTSAATRRPPSSTCSPTERGRRATLTPTCGPARSASAPRPTTLARAGWTRCRCTSITSPVG